MLHRRVCGNDARPTTVDILRSAVCVRETRESVEWWREEALAMQPMVEQAVPGPSLYAQQYCDAAEQISHA